METETAAGRATAGHILFPGNPCPEGHAIQLLVWDGRLTRDGGLWFDLHLEAEIEQLCDGNDEPDEDDAWVSRSMWDMSSCILSSTHWREDAGFLVGSPRAPLDFGSLHEGLFELDPLPLPASWDISEDPAFHIYVLGGHNSVAGHRIVFSPVDPAGRRFALEWSGRIALTYSGESEYRYPFEVAAPDVEFGGIRVPAGVTRPEALQLLDDAVRDADRFVWREDFEGGLFVLA